jgi:hypothetical protein
MKKYLVGVASAGAFLAPMLAFAQGEISIDASTGISGLVSAMTSLINAFVPIAIVIAVIIVIWGAFQIIVGGSDEEARKSGRSKILWGLIGIFLLLSAWALVSIVIGSLDVTGTPSAVTGTVF